MGSYGRKNGDKNELMCCKRGTKIVKNERIINGLEIKSLKNNVLTSNDKMIFAT